jgi:hypothetical protein
MLRRLKNDDIRYRADYVFIHIRVVIPKGIGSGTSFVPLQKNRGVKTVAGGPLFTANLRKLR